MVTAIALLVLVVWKVMENHVFDQQFALVDDKWLESILNGYDMYCPQREIEGYKWTGELRQLENHFN